MTTKTWTCDIDENVEAERCTNDAARIVTWYDEADEDQDRAGTTIKVCEECFEWVKHGVWETPAVVDVGTALIGPRSRFPGLTEPAPIRPTVCETCAFDGLQRDAVAVVALDRTHGLMRPNADPDGTYPWQVCGSCLAELAVLAGVAIRE